jgi:hypothetical protein
MAKPKAPILATGLPISRDEEQGKKRVTTEP